MISAGRRNSLIAVIWTIAFIVALCVDSPVAAWVHTSGLGAFVQNAQVWPSVLKAPGDFRFNLYVVGILLTARQIRWKQGAFVVLAGIVSGIDFLVKWIAGRYRPFKPAGVSVPEPMRLHPFAGGIYGLFHQRDLSFMSGHACTSFALWAALAVVLPRYRWGFFLLAIPTCVERVIENAHYCSDVVGAIGFAMVCVLLLEHCLGQWMVTADQAKVYPAVG